MDKSYKCLSVSNVAAIELSIVADISCSGKGLQVQCDNRTIALVLI